MPVGMVHKNIKELYGGGISSKFLNDTTEILEPSPTPPPPSTGSL